MPKFMVDLDEAHREKLETHRVRLGLRSHAEVIRYWINSDVSARIDDIVAEARRNIANPNITVSGSGGVGIGSSVATVYEGGTSVQIGPEPLTGSRLQAALEMIKIVKDLPPEQLFIGGPVKPTPGSRLKKK